MGSASASVVPTVRHSRAWLKREEGDTVCAYPIAMVYAGLGERNQALEWLERNAAPGHWLWSYLAIDPSFLSLHAEPRFQALLKKVGLDG